jgi:hypothetical protein
MATKKYDPNCIAFAFRDIIENYRVGTIYDKDKIKKKFIAAISKYKNIDISLYDKEHRIDKILKVMRHLFVIKYHGKNKSKYKILARRELPTHKTKFCKDNIIDFSYFLSKDYKAKTEYLYIFRMNGTNYFKIGYSSKLENVYKRLSQCQTGNPIELTIIAIYEVQGSARSSEKSIHCILKDYRMKGEWFDFDSECLKFMQNFSNLDTINLIENNFEKTNILTK